MTDHMAARVGRVYDGQGYLTNPNSQKARQVKAWLSAIERDRNFGRVLFGLPLIDPSPAFQAWADDWTQRNTRFYRRPDRLESWAALS
jgi:hypothetical protein